MNLSKREVNILIGAAVFLFIFFSYQVLIAPVFEKTGTLRRALDTKKAGLVEMSTLLARYQAVSGRNDSNTRMLEKRPGNFSLFTFLDQQAHNSGVKENVEYMKPFTRKKDGSGYALATVKIKLKHVYLKPLIGFLHRIESSENGVVITSLSLSRAGKSQDLLDAVLETETPLSANMGVK